MAGARVLKVKKILNLLRVQPSIGSHKLKRGIEVQTAAGEGESREERQAKKWVTLLCRRGHKKSPRTYRMKKKAENPKNEGFGCRCRGGGGWLGTAWSGGDKNPWAGNSKQIISKP